MKRLPKALRSILYATVFLLVTGLVILYFVKDSGVSLKDILFWVGGVPIALFSIVAFGDIFGKGKGSRQLSRSLTEQSVSQRAVQVSSDQHQRTGFGLTWIAAGILVWLVSYLL